jgi:hypothetical protein
MSDEKPVTYRISFFEPGQKRGKPIVDHDARTPFGPVAVGDKLMGLMFDGPISEPVATVTEVCRMIKDPGSGEIHDVTLVFSEPLGDS